MKKLFSILVIFASLQYTLTYADGTLVYKAGHASLQEWLLPNEAPYPADNAPTAERVELGKQLFFDPRLSGDQNMSCGTCHNPLFGWSDNLPTAKGFQSMILARATPTIINTSFNTIQMWDGRKESLEDQATGPMESASEMNTHLPSLLDFLNNSPGYKAAFAKAYPGEAITMSTVAKAIASFERTVISNNSPFDQWVKGDASAMTPQQVQGFEIFTRSDKGNCMVCHSAPNFSDYGFHNLGLASFGNQEPDLGRYHERPLKLMRGAFKTPTLRDINLSAPYFHDGSAATLMEVVEHYNRGGEITDNLSPNMKSITLTQSDMEALVAFLEALTSPQQPFALPVLPLN